MTIPRIANLETKSPRMHRVFDTLRKFAATEATVVLIGETGTGKDVLAYTLHTISRRNQGPFTVIDCGALSDALLESELFGHVKGSFTGASDEREGLVQAAHRGTLFLNEVGEASQALQLRLLSLLQYKSYRKVGSPHWSHADVRFVAASNKDLPGLVRSGKFREDLYHRLRLVEILVPPLRDRLEDLPGLLNAFVARSCTQHAKPALHITPDAVTEFMTYHWPGNIRQLEHCVDFLVVTTEGTQLTRDHVRSYILASPGTPEEFGKQLTFFEGLKDLLEQALKKHNWNKTLVAAQLGIDRSTLYRRMRKYGINPRRPNDSVGKIDGST